MNPDFTVVLDERSVVNRIAVDIANQHPLLKDRVETGQSKRISKNSLEFVGAKTVADIARSVFVGSGRVGKKKEADMAKAEDKYLGDVSDFLDSLVASFADLQDLTAGGVEAPELRQESVLGSSTMLRVLAIVWHELRATDGSEKQMPVGKIEEFFRELDGHMRPFAEIKDTNPTTGEAETKYGMPLDNDLWMKTKAFLPGSKAPQARQGTISSLANQMVVWARTGVPSA